MNLRFVFTSMLTLTVYLFQNNHKTFEEFEQSYFKNMFCFVILYYMNLLNVPLITHESN